MKRNKIIYYVSTGLLTALMLMSVSMYLFNHEMIAETFVKLGHPAYVVYPLAFAKIAGLVVLWAPKMNTLKEWAYAGFFFNFVLAFFAHVMINDGEQWGALMALVLLMVSYFSRKKIATA